MPEGDTIHRAATRLKAVLEGQVVERAESRVLLAAAESLAGHRIELVEPRGKHLLFHFDDGRALHSHMGMTGSWHIYRPREAWQKPAHRAAIVLHCPLHWVVCFTPKTLELLSPAALRRHAYLQRLGPDLLAGPPADEQVLARYRQCDSVTIGEAIMNQTIVSGVGNVYKSEVLFLTRIHPLTLVADLRGEVLLELTAKSRDLMSKNLEGYPRTTRHALDRRRFWTYGRSGQPCFVCGTAIEMIRQGDLGRSTYFCPQCQAHKPRQPNAHARLRELQPPASKM
jgi:endonuclease-8